MAHSNLKNDFQTIRDKGTWDRHCILFFFFFFYGKTKAAIVPPVSPGVTQCRRLIDFTCAFSQTAVCTTKNTHH